MSTRGKWRWDRDGATTEAVTFRRRHRPAGRGGLSAFIDEGAEIEGKCTFSGTVMLNGTFSGEIASTDTLIIGAKAVINADIRAGQVLISGQVVGNVRAVDRVELKGQARLFGDIEAPTVILEEGALFDGHCRMTNANQTAELPGIRDSAVMALR
jgi:cytoskeletal protein CcmA (bactofilin family)